MKTAAHHRLCKVRQHHEAGFTRVTVGACSNQNTCNEPGSDLRPGTDLGTDLGFGAMPARQCAFRRTNLIEQFSWWHATHVAASQAGQV